MKSLGLEKNHTISAMQISDLDAVLAIEQGSYAFPWSSRLFEDSLSAGHRCLVITGRNNSGVTCIMGYSVVMVAVGEAQLLNLCINKQYRGAGLGQYLLKHNLALLEADGEIENIYLEVRQGNAVGMAVYLKAGFHQVGIRKNYYPAPGGREDAMVLTKQIKPVDLSQYREHKAQHSYVQRPLVSNREPMKIESV